MIPGIEKKVSLKYNSNQTNYHHHIILCKYELSINGYYINTAVNEVFQKRIIYTAAAVY